MINPRLRRSGSGAGFSLWFTILHQQQICDMLPLSLKGGGRRWISVRTSNFLTMPVTLL
jgi:hypothetical protein